MKTPEVAIRILDKSYNEEMLEILARSPMKSDLLELHFDKSPDIFRSSELWSSDFTYYGVFADDTLAGFGMHLKYFGYINGQIRRISYFGNFCIDQKYRGMGLFRTLAHHMLNGLFSDTDCGFCMILQGNRAADRYFDDGNELLDNMPAYKKLDGFETRSLLIAHTVKSSINYEIRKAQSEDSSAIQELLQAEYQQRMLAPLIKDESSLESLFPSGFTLTNSYVVLDKGTIVGVCTVRDMNATKRTKIIRYKKRLKPLRYLYKAIAAILHYPDLPMPGEAIREVYISNIAIKDRNPEIFRSLLILIYNEYREKKYNLIHIGSFRGDNLLNATKGFLSSSLISNIFYAAKKDANLSVDEIGDQMPFINIAWI